MAGWRTLWLYLPRPLRRLPADLAAMVVLTLLVNVSVFAPIVRETPLRIVFGLVFVLLVPGYAFIAALFPEAGESPTADDSTLPSDGSTDDSPSAGDSPSVGDSPSAGDSPSVGDSPDDDFQTDGDSSADDAWLSPSLQRSGIDGIERVALSFGLSIAIVPLIGLVLNFTPWGIRLVPIMIAVSGFTLIATTLAAVRRWQLPPEERFHVPYREWLDAGRRELLEPETRTDGLLNVLLVLSILLAVGTVTFAIVVPPQGEQFSAIYILTEDDDGDLVAANYPSEFDLGDSAEIVVGVDNNEHRSVEYTVVVVEQSVEIEGNETIVTEQRELDRFETDLPHNESWHHHHEIEPTIVGDDVRIVWLLFLDDEVPAEPTREDTEYTVHLWVNVSDDSN